MAWVRFNRKYRWRVPGKGMSFLTFSADRSVSVKAQCAADAIADGAAEALPAPRRSDPPKDAPDGAGA